MTRFPRLVVAALGLVYGFSGDTSFAADGKALPAPVLEMREALLAAARSGSADDFKSAMDISPAKPDLGGDANQDILQILRAGSSGTDGHEALAALSEVLDVPPAILPLGRDLENNLVYVWPYLSTKPLDTLTAAEDIDLYRLVTPSKAAEMREKKRWLWWQIEIAADGRLLSLKKHN